MFGILDISTSGLVAQRIRMDVVAGNLANAESFTATGEPYQRRVPIFSSGFSENQLDRPGVHVSEIVVDTRPGQKMHDPTHPYADKDGYVTLPNVNELDEMLNAMDAARAYDANITAMNVTRAMAESALKLIA